MNTGQLTRNLKLLFASFVIVIAAVLACARAAGPASAPWNVSGQEPAASIVDNPTSVAQQAGKNLPLLPATGTPTPDRPRVLPTLRSEPEEYYVEKGDTLGQIAKKYHLRLQDLIDSNNINNPDILEVGQLLTIPAPTPGTQGTGFKVIPDSEEVYGPGSVDFDIAAFIQSQGGYLASYQDEVYEQTLSAAEVVERVSYEFSVNPRLLLAVLEYQSGWVTQANPDESTLEYPLGYENTYYKGLYFQLSWAANNLNLGYYLWRVNGIGAWTLADGELVPIDPTLNAGTAAVQNYYAQIYGRTEWDNAVGPQGIYATYQSLFGDPFSRAVEPLVPGDLKQPEMRLPFEDGKEWSFTGGPHGGWGTGSAWAALDFAPPGPALGCVPSDEWVVAVADGTILRADTGAVLQDLDVSPGVKGDGKEQTGWTVLYMHIESRDRVQPGTYVRAGERIGHPSCEGGVSTGTHVHLARRYNGEWIPADQNLPFVLDGWISRGSGGEYDGYLQKDGQTVEAWEGRVPANAIQR